MTFYLNSDFSLNLNLIQNDEKINLDNFITEFEKNILGKKIKEKNDNKHYIQIFQNL